MNTEEQRMLTTPQRHVSFAHLADFISIRQDGMMLGTMDRVISMPQDPAYNHKVAELLKDRYYVGHIAERFWYALDPLTDHIQLRVAHDRFSPGISRHIRVAWSLVAPVSAYVVQHSRPDPDRKPDHPRAWLAEKEHVNLRSRRDIVFHADEPGEWGFRVIAYGVDGIERFSSIETITIPAFHEADVARDVQDQLLQDAFDEAVVKQEAADEAIAEVRMRVSVKAGEDGSVPDAEPLVDQGVIDQAAEYVGKAKVLPPATNV